jgi:hypothetical protein
MIKALKKQRRFLNVMKAIHDKLIAKQYTKWKTTETIFAKLRNETRVPTFPILSQYSFGIPSQSNKTGTRNKSDSKTQIAKEEIKLSLFAIDMILCLQTLKIPSKKLLEIIRTFYKVTRYVINIQKSIPFLYTIMNRLRN